MSNQILFMSGNPADVQEKHGRMMMFILIPVHYDFLYEKEPKFPVD